MKSLGLQGTRVRTKNLLSLDGPYGQTVTIKIRSLFSPKYIYMKTRDIPTVSKGFQGTGCHPVLSWLRGQKDLDFVKGTTS